MSLQVFNNTAAFNVWTNFTGNSMGLSKSMNRLASGTIGTADDPSGVGISERMRSQARNVNMARNNVDNATSLLQTADSWLQKINDMLSRMSELAIEGGDGTKTTEDKANIDIEFTQLQEEITRITSRNTSAAKFNGLYLFRGGNGVAVTTGGGDKVGSGSITVQIGADTAQTVDLQLSNLEVTNTDVIGTVVTFSYDSNNNVIGSSQDTVTWASIIDANNGMSIGTPNVVGKLSEAIDFISNARARNGAQQNRLDQTRSALLSYEDNLRSAESKIRDVDMAFETTQFNKFQTLSQVGNSMLAQANQLPQQVLQLLG